MTRALSSLVLALSVLCLLSTGCAEQKGTKKQDKKEAKKDAKSDDKKDDKKDAKSDDDKKE